MRLQEFFFLLLLSLSTLLLTSNVLAQSNTSINVKGTKWQLEYTDPSSSESRSYEISFLKGNVLANKHPNEVTKNDDSWSQTGTTIKLSFNKGYAIYTGKIINATTIVGTATNKVKSKWKWKATRILK